MKGRPNPPVRHATAAAPSSRLHLGHGASQSAGEFIRASGALVGETLVISCLGSAGKATPTPPHPHFCPSFRKGSSNTARHFLGCRSSQAGAVRAASQCLPRAGGRKLGVPPPEHYAWAARCRERRKPGEPAHRPSLKQESGSALATAKHTAEARGMKTAHRSLDPRHSHCAPWLTSGQLWQPAHRRSQRYRRSNDKHARATQRGRLTAQYPQPVPA